MKFQIDVSGNIAEQARLKLVKSYQYDLLFFQWDLKQVNNLQSGQENIPVPVK